MASGDQDSAALDAAAAAAAFSSSPAPESTSPVPSPKLHEAPSMATEDADPDLATEEHEDAEEDSGDDEAGDAAAKKGKDPQPKGLWRRGILTAEDMAALEEEGYLPTGKNRAWRLPKADEVPPKPKADEVVMTVAALERGFSFPPSAFFCKVLETYGLQPHNMTPNSVLILSSFVAVCEGYLGVPPSIDLFQYYFTVKRESIRKSIGGGALATCGSMGFKPRTDRDFPHIQGHESVKGWQAKFFYHKNVGNPSLPAFTPGAATPLPSWQLKITVAPSDAIRQQTRRIEKLDLNGADTVLCWFTRRIQPLQQRSKLLCESSGKTDDDLRISRFPLPADTIQARLKLMLRGRPGAKYSICTDMYIKGNCPKVIFLSTVSLLFLDHIS